MVAAIAAIAIGGDSDNRLAIVGNSFIWN